MSRTFTTPIILPGDPVNALEAAPKQYVDGRITGHSHLFGSSNWNSLTSTGFIQNTTNPSTNQPEAGWFVGQNVASQNGLTQTVWNAEDAPTTPKTWRRHFLLGAWTAWAKVPPQISPGQVDSTAIGFNAVRAGHILDGEVTLPKLSATGTKDATTFLRGDDTWAVPPGAAGSGVPIGAMMMWPTATAPTDWLICDGAAIPSGYTTLIALIGATTPDLVRRVPVGAGGGISVGRNDGVTPASARTFAHNHTATNVNHTGTTNTSTGGTGTRVNTIAGVNDGQHTHGITTQPFDAIPSWCVNFIIKAA
jgi:microcystin-dependent protein